MAIKLYHCKDTRSLRPLWALEEIGIDYELITMPFPPRLKYEGYLEINPLGTVPAFIDGDLTMTESSAIVQYLADKYGPSSIVISRDELEYGNYLDWLHRSDTTLTFPQTLILRYAQFEKPERRQAQVVDDYTQWLLSRLRSVETILQGQNYLCGNRFTIADICVSYAVYLAIKLGLEANIGSKTKAYLDRLMERPAFQRAMAKQASLDPVF